MSSYVRKAATATLTPISTSIGMVKNAYDFLTTSSSDAKDYVKKTVEYLKDGGAAEISGNTLLAAGIGPKLLEVAKTPELEKLTSTMLDVLKDVLSILQSEELTKITTNALWLIKSKPVVDLLSHLTGLTLEALKLMQTKEMSGVRLQLETLINSILGEYVKQKTDKSSAAGPDKWVTILLFLEKLVQFNQLTSSEASRCRRLARKQNFELLILFNAHGVAEYNAIIAADGKNIYQDIDIGPEKQEQQKKKGSDKHKTPSHPTTSSSNHHTTSPVKPSLSHAHDDFHIPPQRSTPVNVQLHHHHGQYATYNPKHYRSHPHHDPFQQIQPDHQRSQTSYHGQTRPTRDRDRPSIHSNGRYSSEEEAEYEYQQQMYAHSVPSHDNNSTPSTSQAQTQQAQTEYQATSASTFVRYVREMLNEEDTP